MSSSQKTFAENAVSVSGKSNGNARSSNECLHQSLVQDTMTFFTSVRWTTTGDVVDEAMSSFYQTYNPAGNLTKKTITVP